LDPIHSTMVRPLGCCFMSVSLIPSRTKKVVQLCPVPMYCVTYQGMSSTQYVATSCTSRLTLYFASRKSLNSILFPSDETQLLMSVATLRGVYRSVVSPGTLWLSSFVSMRLRLRCRVVVCPMYSFLGRDPSGRRDEQVNS
jgi:hypothetical protein